MSTWTSKVTAIVAALGLAGCGLGVPTSENAPLKVQFAGGIVVEGSRGWCADPTTIRSTTEASMVVFGSCAAISGDARLPKPAVPGILTVSVDRDALGTVSSEDLAAYFGTKEGRAALARDGRAESVRILESRRTRETLFLHAVDKSGVPTVAAEDYWRAIFDIDGRFVTVSLVGLTEDPIARDVGLSTLEAQVARIRAANTGWRGPLR